MMLANVRLAQRYIAAIAEGKTGDTLASFFTPDVTITEMPNRIKPHGSVSDLARTLDAAKRGQQLFSRQTYTITNILGDGDWVALELDWSGITAVPIQNLPTGSEMKDRAAVFLQFREGRIVSQRHYDCFESW
jgi:ketosteroid isomerase-like protein